MKSLFARLAVTVAAAGLSLTSAFAAPRTDLAIGMQLEPPHLDPTSAAAGAIDQVLYANVYEGLTRFTADGAIVPALAKSWDISDDGLSYTFTLEDGVTFHNGDAMTAADVKFSLDRARAEHSTNAQKALFTGITDVTVIDDVTLRLTLDAPNGQLLFNLAWGDAVVVNETTIADITTTANGTGPFVVDRWVKGDRIDLVRNPAYWGEAPQLNKATFRFIADPSASFAAMMAGDIDAFPNYPAPETLAQFSADPRFTVINGSTEGETILAMNNKDTVFADRRVRKAVAHAIDRQAIIDGAMFGFGTPIGTHFAPHHPDYIDLTGQSAYDPALAKTLLAEAGYPNGFTTTLKLPPPSYARRGGEIIAAQLKDVGITAEITTLEWAQWLEDVFRGKNYGLTIVSHTEPYDIGIYARPDYYFQYDNADLQNLISTLAGATNPDQRRDLVQKAQLMIADDYVNAYLFQLPQAGVINARIKGLWENAPTQATDLTGVYWTD
ncbi:MAG: ABC transporter substrate-binding protein [Alphaproteobacteria bacterium]|nr:ABC transporter substrate-binding protein [Alphaproteobacteria bacterium]